MLPTSPSHEHALSEPLMETTRLVERNGEDNATHTEKSSIQVMPLVSTMPSSSSNVAHIGIERSPLLLSQAQSPYPSSTPRDDDDDDDEEEFGPSSDEGTNYESRYCSRTWQRPGECPNWFRFPIFADLIFDAVRNRWLCTITLLSFLCEIFLSSSRFNAHSCEGERMIESPSCSTEVRSVVVPGHGYMNQSFAVLNNHGINNIDDVSIRWTSIVAFGCILIGNSKRHSVLWLLPSAILLSLDLGFSSRSVTFCTLTQRSYAFQDPKVDYRSSPRCVDREGFAFQVDQFASPFDQACQQAAINTCEFDNAALSYYSDALNNILAYVFLLTQLIFCIGLMVDASGENLARCYRPASYAWFKGKHRVMKFINWTERKIWPISIDTPAVFVIQSDPTGVESPMQLADRIESMKRQQHEAELRAEKEKQRLEILSSTFRYPIRLWLSATLLISAIMVWGITALIYLDSVISKIEGWNVEYNFIEVSKIDQWVREIRACFGISSILTGMLILYALWVAQRDFKRDCLKNPNIVALLLKQAKMKEKITRKEEGRELTIAAPTSEATNGDYQNLNDSVGSHAVNVIAVTEEGEALSASASFVTSMHQKPTINSEEHLVADPIVTQAQSSSSSGSVPVSSSPPSAGLVDPVFIPVSDGDQLSNTLLGCVSFIGSYVATLLLASVMLWGVSLLILLIIIFDPLREVLLSFWKPIGTILITKLAQRLLYRMIRKKLIGPKPYVLQHPRLFALADLILALTGALTGPLSAVGRVGFSLGSAFVQMFRLDRSIVLPPFQNFDPVYSNYTSLILSMEYQIRGQNTNRPRVL